MLLIPVLLLFVSSGLGQDKRPWHSVTSGHLELSFAFDKMYESEITPEMLAKSPSWDAKTDNPPLPAGKAIRLANALKNKLVKDSKDFKWYLASVTLENSNRWSGSDAGTKWWWSINYEASQREGGDTAPPKLGPLNMGFINHFDIIVLMDGTVVEPKISKYK